MSVELRIGTAADAPAVHQLIATNVANGHLLPRTEEEIALHVDRFVVAIVDGELVGCGELAPLSDTVAEVRSLVVDEHSRGQGTGAALVSAIAARGRALGFLTLSAFTHQPSHFVRLGFSIVPHAWVPEKIAHDCAGCALFRRCGQYAVSLALQPGAGLRLVDVNAAPRVAASRRSSVERLRLIEESPERERIPA
ncbi:MAG TPA: GNAT family N-acetyltransferase [Vicinamibacterales bacterium]|nr:GNAT family N-acetyltransferase [Vicinamibacterales bacterium]